MRFSILHAGWEHMYVSYSQLLCKSLVVLVAVYRIDTCTRFRSKYRYIVLKQLAMMKYNWCVYSTCTERRLSIYFSWRQTADIWEVHNVEAHSRATLSSDTRLIQRVQSVSLSSVTVTRMVLSHSLKHRVFSIKSLAWLRNLLVRLCSHTWRQLMVSCPTASLPSYFAKSSKSES